MTNPTSSIPTVNNALVNPMTGKPAGTLQGVLLLIGSCLPVLGAVLLAPILPTLSGEFKDVPGSVGLVPLILTIPALFIALIAPFAGAIVDKFGRKRVMIIALIAYAILGTAPIYLDSLGAIVATRVGVGITEAFIITCCTTLIADYFVGNRRNKYLSLQALVTALAATVFFAVGGALGALGSRVPFYIYAISLIVAVAMAFAIWPTRADKSGAEQHIEKLPPVPWRAILLPVIFTIFGGVVFYTLIVELPYVLDVLGVKSTGVIGGITAVASFATAIGAFSFRFLARRGVRVLLPIALILAGVGDLVVWSAHAVPVAIVGAVITSLGTGLLLPTMITWAIARLSYEQRGRGSGLFASAIFLGEFACPLVILAISGGDVAQTAMAIGVIGIASLVVCAIVSVILVRVPQPALAEPRVVTAA